MSESVSTRPTDSAESAAPASPNRRDRLTHHDPGRQRIWDAVSHSPLHSLWDLQGTPFLTIAKRTANAFMEDNLLSRAAELGFYFLFALFPTLISASAILGLVARSASNIYVGLLNYLAIIVPHDAFQMVLDTFNQTAAHSSSGKITFGLVAAIWSASVGFSAIQDTLNTVYKVKETRPYWKARGSAMLVTVLLSLMITLALGSLALGTYLSHKVRKVVPDRAGGLAYGIGIHLVLDLIFLTVLILLFATIYYFAPDVKNKHWRWITPGSVMGILGWFISSLGLRLYLHYFNSYSVTYGSLGAVIILLTWFYITGVMLLLGAEINSEIEACAAERKLQTGGSVPSSKPNDPASTTTGAQQAV